MSVKKNSAAMALGIGAIDRAISDLTEFLAHDPEDAEAHTLLSVALVHKQKPFAAFKEAEYALRYDPELSIAHTARANAALHMDDVRTAKESIAEALRLEPENTTALSLRCAMLLRLKKDYRALRNTAQTLVEQSPESPKGYYNLSRAAAELGEADEAEKHARECLRLAPNTADGHEALGWALWKKGDYEGAREAGLMALSINPQDVEAKRLLIACEQRKKRLVGWMYLLGMKLSVISVSKAVAYAAPIAILYLLMLDIADFFQQDELGQDLRHFILMLAGLVLLSNYVYMSKLRELLKEAKLKRGY